MCVCVCVRACVRACVRTCPPRTRMTAQEKSSDQNYIHHNCAGQGSLTTTSSAISVGQMIEVTARKLWSWGHTPYQREVREKTLVLSGPDRGCRKPICPHGHLSRGRERRGCYFDVHITRGSRWERVGFGTAWRYQIQTGCCHYLHLRISTLLQHKIVNRSPWYLRAFWGYQVHYRYHSSASSY